MNKNLVTVKEVSLHNNCPVCYAQDGLLITFKQKVVETNLYKSITPDITHDIKCTTCDNDIYPVQWTDDIERVVDYHQRAFKPMATSTYLKKMSWIIIGSAIFLTTAILGLLFYK